MVLGAGLMRKGEGRENFFSPQMKVETASFFGCSGLPKLPRLLNENKNYISVNICLKVIFTRLKVV